MEFHGEENIDKLVRKAFFPLINYKGVFIEVGAADPSFLSNSKHFRDSGWDIISIEPNPYFAKRHREAGNNILEYACGEKDEDNILFEIAKPKVNGSLGAITFESFSAIKIKEKYKKNDPSLYENMDVEQINVKMRRLDTLLLENKITNIDILSVDVEGWELEVLSGLNFNTNAPKLLIVENWLKEDYYITAICRYGYDFVCRIYPNDVFVKNGSFSQNNIIKAKILAGLFRTIQISKHFSSKLLFRVVQMVKSVLPK